MAHGPGMSRHPSWSSSIGGGASFLLLHLRRSRGECSIHVVPHERSDPLVAVDPQLVAERVGELYGTYAGLGEGAARRRRRSRW